MRTAWTRASILLVGALLVLSAAMWMVTKVRAQARVPQMLETARQALLAGGGEEILAERQRVLTEMYTRLEREQMAMSSDAELFSNRVGEVLVEMGLVVTASSGWRAISGFEGPGAAFERSFSGSGSFEALLDALGTIESWPDRARVRSLSVTPEAPGSILFTFEIAAVRLRPHASNEKS